MKQYGEVLRQIDQLEAMIPRGFISGKQCNFSAVWQQIRETGRAFKGVRFPTQDEHEQAWSRFQDLVAEIKNKQSEWRLDFEKRRDSSETLRDSLIRRAENALPDTGFADVILTLATGGMNIIARQALDALLGPFDERKEELLRSSRALKAVWDDFSSRKSDLFPNDRGTAYHAIKNQQQKLDDLWSQYRAERQKTLDAHYQEKRRRHEEWRQRTLGNIRRNQERELRLEEVLAHKRRHLVSLYDRLADAWSENYRSRVEGWIAEEESAVSDIQVKIDRIRGWIAEDLAKLND